MIAMDTDSGDSLAVGAGFAAVAVGVAAALIPLRTMLGAANVALIMVLVVVIAASLGGRIGGAVTAVAASVAFNFFHTKPYLTVRIEHPQDIATVVLILAVGLAVGELGVARARQSATRRSHLRSIRSLEQVGALVSSGAPVESVWPAVRDALVSTLSLRSARFDAYVHHPIPVVERDGRVDVTHRRYVGDGFALPDTGAALNVSSDGEFLGQILLVPDATVGVSREQRRAAVAIADQFAIVLKRSEKVRSFG
jgi:K+-sensing histidine kinase KdpD